MLNQNEWKEMKKEKKKTTCDLRLREGWNGKRTIPTHNKSAYIRYEKREHEMIADCRLGQFLCV